MAEYSLSVLFNVVDKASKEVGKINSAFEGTVGSLAKMAAGAIGGYMALSKVGDFVKSSITDTVAYAETVDKLARFWGVSAEEASTLIQVADDLRISEDSLRLAMRNALDNGVQPSIEGIMGLADQYRAITDPVEKANFLMETFGARAGPEMRRLLEQTPEAIQEMAESAEDAGLVMTEQGVQSAMEYQAAMDNLSDSVQGVKTQLGNELIPMLTDVMASVSDNISEFKTLNQTHQDYIEAVDQGLITQEDFDEQLRLLKNHTSDLDDYTGYLNDRYQEYYERIGANVDITDDFAGRMKDDIPQAAGTAADALDEDSPLGRAFGKQYELIDQVNRGMDSFNEKLVFQQVAARLDAESQLELGLALGVIDDKTILLNAALPGLEKFYDENQNGAIDAGTEAANYAAAVERLYNIIAAIPEYKKVTIEVDVEYDPMLDKGGPYVPFQHGGMMVVPQGYENDRMKIGVSSGEGVIVIPKEQMVTNNFFNLNMTTSAQTSTLRNDFLRLQGMKRL